MGKEIEKNGNLELNPNVSVDCVIFGFDGEKLKVLLIGTGSKNGPRLALPGNLIYDHENLDQAANRVLNELTGLSQIYLEQIGAFGDPGRISKASDKSWLESIRSQPEARVITVAYFSLVKMEDYHPHASSFAMTAEWFSVEKVTELAFDHFEILSAAKNKLKRLIKLQPIGFNLLPEKFTLSQLHRLYESILEKPLDKRNFRRKIQKLDIVISLDEKQSGVPHKPSQLFMFNKVQYEFLSQDGYDNFGF